MLEMCFVFFDSPSPREVMVNHGPDMARYGQMAGSMLDFKFNSLGVIGWVG